MPSLPAAPVGSTTRVCAGQTAGMLAGMSWQPPGGYPPPGGPPGYPMPPGYPAAPYGAAPVMYMPPTPGPAPGLAFAGFWRRFCGYLLDGLIIGVPILVLEVVLFW